MANPHRLNDDPDAHHLVQLLGMLPGPDDITFWHTVDRNGRRAEQEEAELTGHSCLIKKMEIGIRGLLNPEQGDIAYFCEYLLRLFSGERPLLWEHLNAYVAHSDIDRAGERWARDLTDTAWQLFVRYGSGGQRALTVNWSAVTKIR
ncbi:hypothetical protein [Streptomyces sp. RP5T]|uniref:hypothetical protein n=1 Tax=Streptomyces sp. RP5T TaxID=2490848 RepID=UPI000F64655F|nr:hypothetical protein [Streptomyces sp. RP5T]RRR79263.1 hypothetical protein EHS43_24410 [Streptomyces sp. RP5T]